MPKPPGMEWNNHIISLEKPNLTICFMTHDGTKDNEEGQANAEFIVRACNSYYDLLALIERVADAAQMDDNTARQNLIGEARRILGRSE